MAEETNVTNLIRDNGWNGADNFNRVWRLIYQEGMDAESLNTSNVEFIQQQLSKGAGQTMDLDAMVDSSILKDKYIFRVRAPSNGNEIYLLADNPDNPITIDQLSPTQDRYSFEQFIATLTDVDIPIKESQRKERDPPLPKNSVEDIASNAPAKKRSSRREFTGFIHGSLYDYLVGKRHELVEGLYREPTTGSKDVKQNSRILRQRIKPDVHNLIINQGLEVEAFSIFDFMGEAVKRRSRRLTKDVGEYLRSSDSKFLDDFDYTPLLLDKPLPNEAAPINKIQWKFSEVFDWLRNNNPDAQPKDLGFYAQCLSTKYKDKVQKEVLDLFVSHARDYERLRHHRLEPHLLETGTTRDYILALTKGFMQDSQQYQTADINHLLQGLISMGRVTDTSRVSVDYKLDVAVANYLIINFDAIDGVMKDVYGRIKEGKIDEDSVKSHQPIYKKIQDGTLPWPTDNFSESNPITQSSDPNVDGLKRVLDKQLTPKEKDIFASMTKPNQQVDYTYRKDIMRLYLQTQGSKLING